MLENVLQCDDVIAEGQNGVSVSCGMVLLGVDLALKAEEVAQGLDDWVEKFPAHE